jgi:hypothetical protein
VIGHARRQDSTAGTRGRASDQKVDAAAAVSPTIIIRSARAKPDTRKIGQWTHFVPAFDEWFDKNIAPSRARRTA